MKRRFYLFTVIFSITLLFIACGKKSNQEEQVNQNNQQYPWDYMNQMNVPSLEELEQFVNQNPEDYESDMAPWSDFVDRDRLVIEAESIPVNSLSEVEIKEIINSCDNLSTADNFYINIPESAPVLEFISREDENVYKEHMDPDNRNDFPYILDEFNTMWAYLFSDREWAGSRYEEIQEKDSVLEFTTYYEYYSMDDISGASDGFLKRWDNYALFRTSGFLDWRDTWMNRGTVVKKGLTARDFEFVGSYSPYSTESFKLYDKEMPINEAVAFYENYVNDIPYPDKNLDITVSEVEVYKADLDTYGYYFITTVKNHGIIYDYRQDVNDMQGDDCELYNPYSADGFMFESSNVAYIHNSYLLTYMDDVQEYDSVIPFEDAIKVISDELDASVELDVQKAELVYTLKSFVDDYGKTIVTDGAPRTTVPCWKLTLYNENDEKFYDCYVNAKDGTFKNFSYTSNGYSENKVQQEN